MCRNGYHNFKRYDSSRMRTTSSTATSLDGSSSSRRTRWGGCSEEQSPEAVSQVSSLLASIILPPQVNCQPVSGNCLEARVRDRLAEKQGKGGKREYANTKSYVSLRLHCMILRICLVWYCHVHSMTLYRRGSKSDAQSRAPYARIRSEALVCWILSS